MTATPERARQSIMMRDGERYVPEASEITDRLVIPRSALHRAQPSMHRAPQPMRPMYPFVPAPRGSMLPHHAAGLAMKRRNPLAAWLGLPLLTLGVYSFVWYYKIHREMAEFDRRRAVPVAGPMLVLLLLSWTIVAPLVSFFNTGHRIATAQRAAGLRATCNPWIGLLLCFAFGLQVLYYQAELNKVVDSYGRPEGSEIALRA